MNIGIIRAIKEYEIEREVKAVALSKNCEVVYDNDYTLLLDLDDGTVQYNSYIEMLGRFFPITAVGKWPSSGGNTHIKITLVNPLPRPARIALQAILGSDPVRELFNLVRELNGLDDPNVLFRPKEGFDFGKVLKNSLDKMDDDDDLPF